MNTNRFAHHRLDAFFVAKAALVAGDAIVKKLPRGYGPLGDQLRRALFGAYLQLSEAASREGNDRKYRFRIARGECNEAAAAVEAAAALGIASGAESQALLVLLDRLAAMLARLGGSGT
jgi:four helix bundle protein